jgi:uncharacterized protein YecT (DUF1311 family)
MKTSLILASALLAAGAGLAHADEDGNSPAYASCMEAANGVTLDMTDCMGHEIALHDARLNSAYKAAMASLTGDLQTQLRGAQRLWIQYRDAECRLRGSLTGGSIDRINGGACMLDMTRERADQLAPLSAVEGRGGLGATRQAAQRQRPASDCVFVEDAGRILPGRHLQQVGQHLLGKHPVQPPQLADRVTMVIDPDVPQRVFLGVDHIDRRRGFAVAVPTLQVAGGDGGQQPLHQRPIHGLAERRRHRYQHLAPSQPIALYAKLFTGDKATPGQAALAGPARHLALPVDHRHLAQRHDGVGALQLGNDLRRGSPLSQQPESIQPQIRIDLGLGRDRAHPGGGVAQQLAHGGHGGGGGHTELPAARTSGDNGKRHTHPWVRVWP